MDERVVSALHDVAMTGRVRRLHYEHAEGLSLQQAQRDLRDLVAQGLLSSVVVPGRATTGRPHSRSRPDRSPDPPAVTSPYKTESR